MEGCVSVDVLCAGRRGATGKSRGGVSVCPSLCHQFPAILSPYSTPPSMCCLWIKLIKAPQIRSPGREGEGEFALTSTYTHFLMNAGFGTQFMQNCALECSQPPLWTTFSCAL